MNKGQMVLIAYWFWNDLAQSYGKKMAWGGAFEQLFGPGRGEFDRWKKFFEMPGGVPGGDVDVTNW